MSMPMKNVYTNADFLSHIKAIVGDTTAAWIAQKVSEDSFISCMDNAIILVNVGAFKNEDVDKACVIIQTYIFEKLADAEAKAYAELYGSDCDAEASAETDDYSDSMPSYEA